MSTAPADSLAVAGYPCCVYQHFTELRIKVYRSFLGNERRAG